MSKVTDYALYKRLEPYIVDLVGNVAGGGSASGGMVAHALSGVYHTGVLAESQAPWVAESIAEAIQTHNADEDAHGDGVAIHGIISDRHTVTGSQYQVVGLTATDTLGKLTPSSAPGAASALLKSSATGNLALPSITTPLINTSSGDLALAPNSGLTKATGKLIADGVVGTAPSNAVPVDLDASLYVDGSSSAGVANIGTSGWGKSGYVAFNAYQVTPRPNDGNPATAGNMKFYGGNAGSTRAWLSVFDGNAGTFKQYMSPSSYADGDGITWTELTSLTSSGHLSVAASVRTPLLATDSGNMEIAPAGDLILDPAGNDVLPELNYDINLGAINKKYLTLHAAELWVETLVAQETIATIGGRILVGPTNILEADLATGSTTITVKYNNFLNGDRIYMEAAGKIEFMAVTSTYSGTGPYTYTVTRNLDGTGANQWYAGDALFNTGQTGNGWIDLYSLYGMNSAANVAAGTQRAGPTIVGNVRLSSTYNDFRERWAIGSLNGLYDYSSAIYGFAAGNPTATWVGLDATYGLRMMSGSTKRMEITPAGTLNINNSAGSNVITMDGSGNSYFAGVMTIGTSGEIRQGTGTLGSNYTGLRIWRSSNVGLIGGYNSNTLQWYADTDGTMKAGGGDVELSSEGIGLQQDGYLTLTPARAITWYQDIATKATITQSISAYTTALNENALILSAQPQGGIYTDSRVTLSAGTTDFTVYSDGYIVSEVTIQPASDSTTDLGTSSVYWNNLYARNLHVDTIVGTPSYSHSHSASDITSGTLNLARIPATLTGKDADTVDGLHASSFSLTNHTHSYLPLSGGTMTGNILFSGAQTVDGVDISAFKAAYDTHNHDSRYYTETEINAFLTGYVPTTRQVIAGSGLSGGGALSANVTLSHAVTSSVADSSNSNGTVLQSLTFDGFGHVLTRGTVNLDSRYGQLGAANTWTAANTFNADVTANSSQFKSVSGTSGSISIEGTSWGRAGYVFFNTEYAGSGNPLTSTTFTTNDSGSGTLGALFRFDGNAKTFSWQISNEVANAGGAATYTELLNLNSTNANFAVNVNVDGTIDATGNLLADGYLRAGEDTDSTHILGRIELGNAAGSDSATFSHYDFANSAGFALAQYNNGSTVVQAAAGQTVSFSIDDSVVWSVNAERLLPGYPVLFDIGDYNRQVRTLYAAEMYVQNLVAADVRATIGGGLIVAPTTKLIAEVSTGGTTIDVEHNNLVSGEYIYLKTAPGGVPQIEAMKVTSTYTAITGGYRYSVTRNLDGSGANSWQVGDAVVSLGSSVGDGYLDLTSTSTIHSHLGPTLTVYSRSATTNWNSIVPVVSLGNLRSFVDYASDRFGLALGNNLTLTPTTGFQGITADASNGLRLFNSDVLLYDSSTLAVSMTASAGLDFLTPTVETYDRSKLNWWPSLPGSGTADVEVYTWRYTGGPANVFSIRANQRSGDDGAEIRIFANGSSQTAQIIMTGSNSGDAGIGLTGAVSVSESLYVINAPIITEEIWANDVTGLSLRTSSGTQALKINNSTSNVEIANSLLVATLDDIGGAGIALDAILDVQAGRYIHMHGNQITDISWMATNELRSNDFTYIQIDGDLDMQGNDITDIGQLGEGWTAPTFNTGWSNYGGGFGYQAVKYKKVGDLIFLRGMAQRTSGSATTIFTLPSGHRPSTGHEFFMCISNGDTTARVRVYSTGAVAMESGDYTWISLSGIVFSVL